jgi:hypothetical protein
MRFRDNDNLGAVNAEIPASAGTAAALGADRQDLFVPHPFRAYHPAKAA